MLRTICLLTLIALLGGLNSSADAGDQEPDGIWPTFSVELRPIPFEERERGLALMAELQDKGYLAHAHQFDTDGQSWLIVEVGAFADRNAAAAFSHSFRALEGRRGAVGAGARPDHTGRRAAGLRGGRRPRFGRGTPAGRGRSTPSAPSRGSGRICRRSCLPSCRRTGDPWRSSMTGRVHVASLDSPETRTLTDGQSPQISPVGDYPWQPNLVAVGRPIWCFWTWHSSASRPACGRFRPMAAACDAWPAPPMATRPCAGSCGIRPKRPVAVRAHGAPEGGRRRTSERRDGRHGQSGGGGDAGRLPRSLSAR